MNKIYIDLNDFANKIQITYQHIENIITSIAE